MRLSSLTENNMRLAYWMYEGTAHHGVGRIANSLKGDHAVFHAPQGDSYVNAIFSMLERATDFPAMTTSTVSGRDLAMGTVALPDTLRAVDQRHQPELIVVSASCSTILLQENLEMLAQSAETDADVLVYDANPYRMGEVAAAEGLFTTLVQRYAAPTPRTARPSVNLIGPASLGFHNRPDLIALRRMMTALGVEVNVVAPLGASLDDLRRLPAAWVNIAPYRELGPGAVQHLEASFGIPALTDAPIGVSPTVGWLRRLVALLNEVGASLGAEPVKLPPPTAFSLDGISMPSGVPWFARTADMDSFSNKRAFVFGDATHVVGLIRFLHDELGMKIDGAGTYLRGEADWIRAQIGDYLPGDLLVTDRFQDVAAHIAETVPDLVCGTQMERHSGRKFDIPCMVISPPTHIENHLLSYHPMLGFDGSNYLADMVYTTTKLGLEQHLIDMFGDAGLEYTAPDEPATDEVPDAVPTNGLTWTPDAEQMLGGVPFFVRRIVRKRTEKFAQENGYPNITADVLQEAREALGG
jgi:light-independent protochlorophyllide reductase subunit B